MIWKGDGILQLEEGEPALRSCWECNSAHDHLKKVNTLHSCFSCDRSWVFDQFFDWETDEECDAYFESLGLKKGESTTKIDGGYRVTCITITTGHSGQGETT
jgi:hypothetical protein